MAEINRAFVDRISFLFNLSCVLFSYTAFHVYFPPSFQLSWNLYSDSLARLFLSLIQTDNGSALHEAALFGKMDVVRLLLDSGMSYTCSTLFSFVFYLYLPLLKRQLNHLALKTSTKQSYIFVNHFL